MVTNTDCSNGWVCVNRYQGVANMVGWHNYAGSAPVANWYDGNSLAAFSRGDRAWIAVNNEAAAQTIFVQTGLPAGKYCDIHGSVSSHRCSGHIVAVGLQGFATVMVPAKDSVAIDRLARL